MLPPELTVLEVPAALRTFAAFDWFVPKAQGRWFQTGTDRLHMGINATSLV